MADDRHDSKPANGWDAELARLTDASKVRIWRDDFRRLHVQADWGEEYVEVRPARAFPLTGAAGRWTRRSKASGREALGSAK